MKKLSFESIRNGDKVKCAVVMPSPMQKKNAEKIYARSFADYVNSKFMLRSELRGIMLERNLISKSDIEKIEKASETIQKGQEKLDEGGISLEEAKKIALDMRQARWVQIILAQPQTDMDSKTAEYNAEQDQLDYLISQCSVYDNNENKGEKIFSSLDNFLEHKDTKLGQDCINKFSDLYYGFDVGDLPENKFLKEFGFCDDDFNLVNEKGERVDEDGKPLEIEEEVKPKERKPFLDADGNPVKLMKRKKTRS